MYEVVVGGDVVGYVEVVLVVVGDYVVDSLDVVVEVLFGDFELLEVGCVGVGSIVDFGEVDLDGIFVGGGDGVIWVVGFGGIINFMFLLGIDFGVGWDFDYGVIL